MQRMSEPASRRVWSFSATLLYFLSLTSSVHGHEGPPFPIVVDKTVGPCVVSVWTDPDVGQSLFFVLVNATPGSAVPNDLKVQLGVQPTSGRLPEAFYQMQRDDQRDQVQYKAFAYLDAQEMWRIRVTLASAQGNGEVTAEVEATPPGYGRWDLLIYLLPFLAVGFLWMRAVLRRRRS
jgi:hypothetical protein